MSALPSDFVVYQSQHNLKQETSGSKQHRSNASVLIECVMKSISKAFPNVQSTDIICRDINEYRLLQGHRDGMRQYSDTVTMKILGNYAPMVKPLPEPPQILTEDVAKLSSLKPLPRTRLFRRS